METPDPAMRDGLEDRLDGAKDVLLAPVRGSDSRRQLPTELFTKSPLRFTLKFLMAVLIIAASWAVAIAVRQWWITGVLVIVLGMMYAHLVELQHECLHEHAYHHRWMNRLVGFVCGVPMLSSYSHYKYEHLRHHAFLGTTKNQEFFNYRFHDLDTPLGFARGAFHLGRYLGVAKSLGRSLIGRLEPSVIKTRSAKKIRTEYVLFVVILLATAAISILVASPLVLLLWVLPALLIAEPAHFLIELPEHFGLNTQTDPNVLSNTRTIRAGWFGKWYTNGNDLHTAHHFHQGVPMVNVPKLHKMIEHRVDTIEPSYFSFYRNVANGRIRYRDLSVTCMTR
jgi:fatty acid desaturase